MENYSKGPTHQEDRKIVLQPPKIPLDQPSIHLADNTQGDVSPPCKIQGIQQDGRGT